MPTLARLRYGIAILVFVLLVGSVGYYYLEGLSPLQSFYSAVLVISTLGLARSPSTTGGISLTIVLIVSGVGTLFYLLGQVAESVVETSLGVHQERRMNRRIAELHDHAIICGYGRVGRHAAAELSHENRPFVVVDNDPAAVERARADGYAAQHGDATEDHILQDAGVERAGSLLLTTSSDAVNVFITLSARSLNAKLLIIARANEDSALAKLEKAGANHVIAPETIGGKRMAALAVRPDAADVADTLIGAQHDMGWLDQTTVAAGSPLVGRAIQDGGIYDETGARIIAIRRRDGQTLVNPGRDESIREGDILISVGAREEIGQLEGLAQADQKDREER